MFDYIKGTIEDIREGEITIENNGIGYRIYVTNRDLDQMNRYDDIKIFTNFVVREDGVYIYGFLSELELILFNKLTSVSSIGPKTGLAMLSVLEPNDIVYAILNNEIDYLTAAPGIGKKSASRIILELKDKISNIPITHIPKQHENDKPVDDGESDIVMDALLSLGFMRQDIIKVMKKVDMDDKTVEVIIKECIKQLSN